MLFLVLALVWVLLSLALALPVAACLRQGRGPELEVGAGPLTDQLTPVDQPASEPHLAA